MSDVVTIEAQGARVDVALAGAEALRWSVEGRELLWPGDAKYWRQISPILYPVVGFTRDGARVGGKRYDLGLHGFAAAQTFVLERSAPGFARLALTDNAQTRAVYPFAFALAVEYRLDGASLAIALEVANPGAAAAPYACGLHPGFRWPLGAGSREGAFVRFDREERAEIPVLAPGGLISARRRRAPLNGRDLALADALFADGALCFLDCRSRALSYIDGEGSSITMDFPGFDHVALWTLPGAPYLCLEPWTGYGDPEGFDGDLFDKPSMRALAPGDRARREAKFTFRAA